CAIAFAIARRTSGGNFSRRRTCRRCGCDNVAEYCRKISLATPRGRSRGAAFLDRSNSKCSLPHWWALPKHLRRAPKRRRARLGPPALASIPRTARRGKLRDGRGGLRISAKQFLCALRKTV